MGIFDRKEERNYKDRFKKTTENKSISDNNYTDDDKALLHSSDIKITLLNDTILLHINDTAIHFTGTEKINLFNSVATLLGLSNLLPLPLDITKTYSYTPGTGWEEVTGGGGTDEKVKYDAGDPTAGYIVDKFIAGVGITLSEGTGANVNKLKITNNSTLRPPVIDWYDPSAGLPVAPTVGDRYISDGSGSGWTDGYIYEWDGTTWVEEEPDEGWMVWMLLELIFYVFFSGGWMEAGEFTFVKLDQTIPQTFTGGALVGTGLINVTAGQIGLDTKAYIEGSEVSANETDPVFSGSEAANFVAGDKANLDNQSGVNTGDQASSDFDHNALQNTHTIPPQSGDAEDTPIAASTFPFWDTVNSLWKKITLTNLISAISSGFSALFAPISVYNNLRYDSANSIALEFHYLAGQVRSDNTVTDIVAGHIHLTDDDVNYVEVDMTGAPVVSVNIVGFTTGNIPLYEVTAASGAITIVTDKRASLLVASGGGGGGHEILDKDGTGLTQREKLKFFQEVADDAGNDTTKVYPTFKKAGFVAEYDNGNSGAAKTIDFNNGQNQKITLTADCTLSFTALSDINASTFRVQLKVIQDGTGGWNLYFPVGTIFCNGAFDFSTGTASQTCLIGIYFDGSTYYVIPTLYF